MAQEMIEMAMEFQNTNKNYTQNLAHVNISLTLNLLMDLISQIHITLESKVAGANCSMQFSSFSSSGIFITA